MLLNARSCHNSCYQMQVIGGCMDVKLLLLFILLGLMIVNALLLGMYVDLCGCG